MTKEFVKAQGRYWLERAQSLSAYLIIIGLVLGVWFLIRSPRGVSSKTTTNVGKADKIVNITHNEAPERKQGLYVALTSESATVGVFKQMTDNFRVSVGAGQSYDSDIVAEVRGEVSF